ncbi:MAG: PASTA domain-containing protein [Bacteroidales bacterium]|nr:PASTA domain-containing protein [Bacteroidales bacterium]
MEEQNKSFGDKLKAWGKFFISPYFLKNISIFLGTVILFFVIVVQCLKWYTRHNQQLSVPAVEGMTIAEAEKEIKARGLVPKILDSVFISKVAPGHIIPGGQQPIAGYAVKKGRIVYLTYMAFTKEPTTMPKIEGESKETAKSLLIGKGLVVGKETERAWPYKNQVIEARHNGARISPGKELHKGDIIDLVIGKGNEDNEQSASSIGDETSTPDNYSIDTDEF